MKILSALFFLFSFSNFILANASNPYLEPLENLKEIIKENKGGSRVGDVSLIEKRLEKIHEDLTSIVSSRKKKYLKGECDPNFPVSFEAKPNFFSLPYGKQKQVSWKDLSPQFLKSLSNKHLRRLMEGLRSVPFQLKWKNKEGKNQSGVKRIGIRFSPWEKTNGAAVLALSVGIKKEHGLLKRMLVMTPDAISFGLKSDTRSILKGEMIAWALIKLIEQSTPHNARQIASSAANLAQIYIEYWADEKASRLVFALTKLVLRSAKLMKSSKVEFGPDRKGILLGALLSGALLRVNNIKSKDEKKLWVINSISNLAWAASTFLGVIPVAGSVIAGVAGSLSVAVVTWGVVANKIGVRDFSPKIKEIEGHIEFSALEAAKLQRDDKVTLSILETLAWMRSTIHINGLSD